MAERKREYTIDELMVLRESPLSKLLPAEVKQLLADLALKYDLRFNTFVFIWFTWFT